MGIQITSRLMTIISQFARQQQAIPWKCIFSPTNLWARIMAPTKIIQELDAAVDDHPYAFHVSGPRNVPLLNWKDLVKDYLYGATWKDANHRRTAMACFVQSVYLLELDKQEKRTEKTALAPKWWKPFKYKVAKTLVDARDGSIYGALLEWDKSAALTDFILRRPPGAPKAVLALRGTLLRSLTIRRDIVDDLRFLTWESLTGSVRFNGVLEALRLAVSEHGMDNVSVAGHSLGAGFALQVGKALAKQGIYIETHLFNPPSVSLASSLRVMGEKAGFVWKNIKSNLPLIGQTVSGAEAETIVTETKVQGKWIPHLYVNSNDYICCYYQNAVNDLATCTPMEKVSDAKLYITSKEKQKFVEAHGLKQWWSDDAEFKLALHDSKLISRQLQSLYTLSPV